MSQQYSVAAVFVFKELAQSNYEKYSDPRVNKLASLATVEVDDAISGAYPKKQGCEITITLKGGKVIHDKMDDLEVMTDERVIANFEAQATRTLSKKQADELKNAILNLDKLDNIGSLVKLSIKK